MIALGKQIANRIGVHSAGLRLLLRRMFFLTVFIGGVTQVKSATNALYLSHREPSGLAQLYLLVALSVAAVSYLLSRSLASRPPLFLLRRLGWVGSLALMVLFVLARLDVSWAYGGLYVFGEFYTTMLSVLFWSDVSERFDLRAQKKVVGLLAAGGMLGTIFGGALVGPIASKVGVDGLIALAAVGLALAIPMLGHDEKSARNHARASAAGSALKALLHESYPRNLAFLVTGLALLATLVDYLFRVRAAAQLDENGLAGLFGQLNAVVGVAGLILQGMLTATLLARFGVFIFLGLIPVLVFILAGSSLLWPSFAVLVALKGVEMIGSFSLYQPGVQLLYGPLHSARRHALRPLIDGAAKKLGVAISGLGLVLLTSTQLEHILVPLILLAVVVIVVVLTMLRRGFIKTLDARLGGRRIRHRYAIDPTDKITRETLIKSLDSDRARDVLIALNSLEGWPGFNSAPYLKKLIVHPREVVRLAAIERALHTRDQDLVWALRQMLAKDRRRVRVLAARALAALQPDAVDTNLRPYLYDKDPGVQVAVIAALLPRESDDQAPAHRMLTELLADLSHPSPLRRELARVLGELSGPKSIPALRRLLHDADPSVRKIACQSAARRCSPDLVDDLFYLLEDRHSRSHTRVALAAYGDQLVPRLEELLNDRDAPIPQRLEVPRVLRLVGTQLAANTLLFSNIKDDATLRYRIAKNLFELARKNRRLRFDHKRIDEAAGRRLRSYRYYQPILRSLRSSSDRAYKLLARAVSDRLSQNLEMALRLIGLTHDPDMMLRIFQALNDPHILTKPHPKMRAEALELIDVALAGDPMRAILLSSLEEKAKRGDDPQAELRKLALSPDALLRALAQEGASRLGLSFSETPDQSSLEVKGAIMDQPFIERVLLLEHVDLFANLSMDDLSALANIAVDRDYAPGAAVYKEGDRGNAMYVIAAGEVELLKGDKVIMSLHDGESIGQVSFMDGGPRPVGARITHDSAGASLLVIERQLFMDLLADRVELANGMFVVLAQRLRKLIDMTGPRAEKPPALPLESEED